MLGCLGSEEVLGKRSGPGAGGLANFRDYFVSLVCRRPDLKEVLVVLEEVLGLLEEVLVSGRGAWILERCLDLYRRGAWIYIYRRGAWIQEWCLGLGKLLGSRRGAWIKERR